MSTLKVFFITTLALVALAILVSVVVGWTNDEVIEIPTDLPVGVNPTTSVSDPFATLPVKVSEFLGGGLYQVTPLTPQPVYNFDILYNANNDSYAVALGAEPLVESRVEAENFLKAATGKSEAELCAFNILVTVPYGVNQFLAGRDLGLSFCPGSAEL